MHRIIAIMATATIGTASPLPAQGIEIVEDGAFISVPVTAPVFTAPIEGKSFTSQVAESTEFTDDMTDPSKLSATIESAPLLSVSIEPGKLHSSAIDASTTFREPIAVPVETEKLEPAPKPEVLNQVATALEDDKTIRFSNITFEVGSAILTAQGQAFVSEIAKALIARPGLNIVISGHTDSTGKYADNQLLSEARANAIRTELIDVHGISQIRLRTVGFGESSPIANNATDAGRALNRRVEVIRWR